MAYVPVKPCCTSLRTCHENVGISLETEQAIFRVSLLRGPAGPPPPAAPSRGVHVADTVCAVPSGLLTEAVSVLPGVLAMSTLSPAARENGWPVGPPGAML